MKLFQKRRKSLLIIGGIVLYFCLLCLISVVKNNSKANIIEKDILSVSDFSILSDPQFAFADELSLSTALGGTDKVFSAPVSLKTGTSFQVQFSVDCPENLVEGVLYVDLYGDNYDREESEFSYSLRAGQNEINGLLPFGENHPESCQLRIFVLDDINISITKIHITRIEKTFGMKSEKISYLDKTGFDVGLLCSVIVLLILSGYLAGLLYQRLEILQLVSFAVALFFSGYVIVSGLFFWVDLFSFYRVLLVEGLFLIFGIAYLIIRRGSFHIELLTRKRTYYLYAIILLGFLCTLTKFDFFGMGQDEGVYQTKALELAYGYTQRQLDFEEYGLLGDETEKIEYSEAVKKLAGFDRYDVRKPTLKEENKISDVSAIFHGIPTFPAILGLFARIFGISSMQQIHSVFFLCAMVFLLLSAEALDLRNIPQALALSLCALSPVVIWVTKSALTECFLYMLMAWYIFCLTDSTHAVSKRLSVVPIITYAFFHVSTFALMPIVILSYLVFYLETDDKEYLRSNTLVILGFVVGCFMMLYVSPTYSFNNIRISLKLSNDYYVIPIMLACSMAGLLLTVTVWKVPILKTVYRRIKQTSALAWGMRTVLVLAVVFTTVQIHKNSVEQSSATPSLFALMFVTGLFALPISLFEIFLHPKEFWNTKNSIVISLLFFYCVVVIFVIIRKNVAYFYYYARYLAPYIPIVAIAVGFYLNKVNPKALLIVLGASLIFLAPFDYVLATQKDDSRMEWNILEDLADVVEENCNGEKCAIVMDQYWRLLALPLKAMTHADVYPKFQDAESQMEFLNEKYDKVYTVLSDIVSLDKNWQETILIENFMRSEDDMQNRVPFLGPLPLGFTKFKHTAVLEQCYKKQEYYDFSRDDINAMHGFGGVENDSFRWINEFQASFYACLERADYIIQIQQGSKIPFGNLKRDSIDVDLLINDRHVTTFSITAHDASDVIKLPISAEYLRNGFNQIEFQGKTWSPSEYGGADSRNLLFSVSSIMFVESFPQDYYDFSGSDITAMHGFGVVENDSFRWINDSQASFYAWLKKTDYIIQIQQGSKIPFGNLKQDSIDVDLLINDQYVTTFSLTANTMGDVIELPISAKRLRDGANQIEFRGTTWSPSEYGNGDNRNFLFSVSNITFDTTLDMIYDVGENELFAIDGFSDPEGEFRWTQKEQAVISCENLFSERDYSGEILLSSLPPDNLLNGEDFRVNVSINNHPDSTQTVVLHSGQKSIPFMLDHEWLNTVEKGNTLAISSELWSPSDYGSTDTRKLGIAVDKIVLLQSDNSTE